MKTTVKLYKASIPYRSNSLDIHEGEFAETDKQFKRIGDYGFIVPKSMDGEPGSGYARTPEQAIAKFRLKLERRLDELYRSISLIQGDLKIVNQAAKAKGA